MTKPDAKRVLNSYIVFRRSARVAHVDTYEDRLERDPECAMGEGSRFFEGKSQVQATLNRITKKLNELGIEYAVAGGMALFKHGYRRFTDGVDILVAKADLKAIHQKLDGLGYLPPFQGSKESSGHGTME